MNFSFDFFSRKKVSSFLFYCVSFKYVYQTLTASSVVGAPWRCGVLTTQGGIAGIGLGRLLEGEHDTTPWSGVEAPRLLKTEPLQIVLLLLLLFGTRLDDCV